MTTKNNDGKRLSAGSLIIKFFKELTARGYFVIWICGLLLIIFLPWQLSGAARSAQEIKLANNVLEEAGEKNKIVSVLQDWLLPGRATQAGTWFLLQDNSIALLFTVPVNGVFAPFLATFDVENALKAIYPLTKTAHYIALKTNSSILDVWTFRITEAAKILHSARE
jgi:hypothetical protein